jgi:hypothetical protein
MADVAVSRSAGSLSVPFQRRPTTPVAGTPRVRNLVAERGENCPLGNFLATTSLGSRGNSLEQRKFRLAEPKSCQRFAAANQLTQSVFLEADSDCRERMAV